MDVETLETLQKLFQMVERQTDWKSALDTLLAALRHRFVYDNVAVYMVEAPNRTPEIIYARAVGRGKTAEADAPWGGTIAAQVLAQKAPVITEPGQPLGKTDRLSQAYMLGTPLYIGARLEGALIFVRFGGPTYSREHVSLASLIASWAASLLERKALLEARTELESVQRQMRLQDDFVSTISHELRTPLGFIKGYSTSLLREDTNWDENTQHEFLTIIDEEADRLTGLIENMLESARLQSKTLQFKFQPLRLDALIRDVTMRITTHHADLKVDLDFETVPPIQGDSVRLSQVFENLFGNAVKYAPGSKITITLKKHGKYLKVAFRDYGPGIPEDFIPFIFERFYRVPGERTVTGTGLGLYICKQIILAHHGKIWAESVLDQGTTFFIQLPADPLK
ncbi:MAG TPA: GAF domain-containing sensor histidine kinase [Anaerolineales bacterium]|nr:GAF domain-containing sensor histidine kinase [Anaerolineales bacterium]